MPTNPPLGTQALGAPPPPLSKRHSEEEAKQPQVLGPAVDDLRTRVSVAALD